MIIASMAVIASRVGNIPHIVSNLERQTRTPDKVLLYYSHEPWHHDEGIAKLEIPNTSLNIEVIRVPNIGSCRKYIFTIERFRCTNASILLLDDDLLWDRSVIETLWIHQNRHRRVVGTRGWSQFEIVRNEKGEEVFQRPSAGTITSKGVYKPTEVIVTSSGWATMFYASDVDERIFDIDLQLSVGLGYSDEVFLAAMLPVSKFVIPLSKGFCRKRIRSLVSLARAFETPRAKALQAMLLGEDIVARAREQLICM